MDTSQQQLLKLTTISLFHTPCSLMTLLTVPWNYYLLALPPYVYAVLCDSFMHPCVVYVNYPYTGMQHGRTELPKQMITVHIKMDARYHTQYVNFFFSHRDKQLTRCGRQTTLYLLYM